MEDSKNAEEKFKQGTLYAEIIKQLNPQPLDHDKKVREILAKIEEHDPKKKRRVFSYLANFNDGRSQIGVSDIAPIGDILASFGTVDYLDFIIHSPGGDANAAEKIIQLCREHCRKAFRVIIPNMAKSAATLIALGADSIVMGHCSELGPIDAQVLVNVSGVNRFISAQAFIDARDNLLKEIEKRQSEGKEITQYLQQLATLNIPFIEECDRLMRYSNEMATKWLDKCMLKKTIKDSTKRVEKAREIANYFSSTEKHLTHAKLINIEECRKLGLHVTALDKEGALWKLIWEYYVWTEIRLNLSINNMNRDKILETSDGTLVSQTPAR